jgi:hypothetical protein
MLIVNEPSVSAPMIVLPSPVTVAANGSLRSGLDQDLPHRGSILEAD